MTALPALYGNNFLVARAFVSPLMDIFFYLTDSPVSQLPIKLENISE
jgi:hypothetical protein